MEKNYCGLFQKRYFRNTVLFLVILSFRNTSAQNSGWFMENGFLTNQFSTKTSFCWLHPRRAYQRNDMMLAKMDNRTCTAIHTNFVMRHGARYPSIGTMREFTNLHEKIKNEFENQSFSFIDNWMNTYPEDKAETVNQLGESEIKYVGTVYGTRLFDLFKLAFNNNTGATTGKLKFASTHKIRTQTTAKIFSGALSEAITGNNLKLKHIPIRDSVLRFFDNCKAYEQATSDRQDVKNFEQGLYFQRIINNVVSRLQLNGTFNADDLTTLYELCATELAINNNPDWCSLLAEDDLNVLQYNSDIEDNIKRLYGSNITGQMSCPLAKDIFTTLDSVIQEQNNGQNNNLGVFQFGHSDTVLEFYAGLGLYKDDHPITSSNYDLLRQRKFNTARVSPFSCHFAFILYDCGGTSNREYAIRLLVNGEPVNIPGCNSDVCNYQDVRQRYRHLVEGCDRERLCNGGPTLGNIVG